MAKGEGGPKSGGASVQFRWPLAVGLFLCLIILLWLWTPDASTYVSLTATQFDLLPVGREDLDAVPASVRGILLNPDLARPSFPVVPKRRVALSSNPGCRNPTDWDGRCRRQNSSSWRPFTRS